MAIHVLCRLVKCKFTQVFLFGRSQLIQQNKKSQRTSSIKHPQESPEMNPPQPPNDGKINVAGKSGATLP
jgi:hypothetical protein